MVGSDPLPRLDLSGGDFHLLIGHQMSSPKASSEPKGTQTGALPWQQNIAVQ
jgi:hypothetical protein